MKAGGEDAYDGFLTQEIRRNDSIDLRDIDRFCRRCDVKSAAMRKSVSESAKFERHITFGIQRRLKPQKQFEGLF